MPLKVLTETVQRLMPGAEATGPGQYMEYPQSQEEVAKQLPCHSCRQSADGLVILSNLQLPCGSPAAINTLLDRMRRSLHPLDGVVAADEGSAAAIADAVCTIALRRGEACPNLPIGLDRVWAAIQ